MSKNILSVKNLSVSIGGLNILKNISFDLNDDINVYGIIGPNGAGKSTLFNCISGNYNSYLGEITFDSNKLPKEVYKRSRIGISRTFQNIGLYKNLTVFDNIRLGVQNYGTKFIFNSIFSPKKADKYIVDKIYDVMKFMNIEKYKDSYVSSLSYGIQRSVEIARSLITESKLILFDEPTAGMNDKERGFIENIISKVSERNVKLIIVEHDIGFIFNISDKVVLLINGELIVDGHKEDIKGNGRFYTEYLGLDQNKVNI